jgi:hypothetical protein
MFSYGLVAAIAFIAGLIIMDVLYAHRFGWLRRKPKVSKETLDHGCMLTSFPVENGMDLPVVPIDWSSLATGKSGWLEIEQAWLRKAQEVYNVFCEKQADYGPTNIGVGGEHGITVRLGDKISRLFELLGLTSRENGGEPANESIRDTWMDLGDYGIIGMIVHDGDWPLVEPNQVWGKEAMLDLMMDMVGDDQDLYEKLMIRLSEFGLAKQIADDLGAEIVDG